MKRFYPSAHFVAIQVSLVNSYAFYDDVIQLSLMEELSCYACFARSGKVSST